MARAFSADLRQRVVEAFDSGMSRRAAAGRFEIGISTAINWVRRWRETGNWAARRPGGRGRPPRNDAIGAEILGLVDQTPDMPLAGIADHLERTNRLRLVQITGCRSSETQGATDKQRNRTRANNS